MINGLRFEIPNEPGKYLFEILKTINIEKYEWYIKECEVYEDENYKELFKSNVISGESICKIISTQKYYIINIVLAAYKNIIYKTDIETYEDFINSKCEWLLCIYDSEYCEIYFKNTKLLNDLYRYLEKDFFNIDYITEKNIRDKLSVF